MALKKAETAAQKPAFETLDEDGNTIDTVDAGGEVVDQDDGGEEEQEQAVNPAVAKAQAAAKARAEAEATAAKPADAPKTTALAAKAGTAVAIPLAKLDPFKELENVFPVKFNTLANIMATNGNFLQKDTSKPMGDTIVLEVISTQKHWVMSPGGDSQDEESLQYLKYSDDGVTTQDGEDMAECRQIAIDNGYDKARITERTILVGSLVYAGKLPELVDTMVQIDLPPTSAAHFDRHRLSTAFNIGKGKATAEGQNVLKLECTVKTKGKMNWTEVVFSKYVPG